MLDKILYKNSCELVLYFTHRSPITLYSSDGKVLDLLDEFLCPFNPHEITSLTEWNIKVSVSNEDTQVINLDEIE